MTQLERIAKDMEYRGQLYGFSSRELVGGLRLELEIEDRSYTLTLSRPAVAPSAQEVMICRRAFGALQGAEAETSGNRTVIRWTIS